MEFLLIYKLNKVYKIIGVFIIIASLFFSPSAEAQKQYVVVLDAGHGGGDPGKVGYKKFEEKDIALKITLAAGKIISKEKDIKVVYTRKTDKFIDLWKRGRIANKAKADLFVSIHCNAHSSQAHGSETWVLGLHANKKNFEVAKRENSVILLEDDYHEKYKGFDPNSPESVIGLTLLQEENLDKSLLLASTVQKHFTSKLNRVDRGVKQAGFVVLHQTTMPSVLIETGFITNKKEALYLQSKKGQKEIATSIAKSIKEYINQLKLNTVVTLNQEDAEEIDNTSEIEFKVQIASGKKKIATKSYNFHGLKGIERTQVGTSYKYYYGKTPNYQLVTEALKKAKLKGYASSFIVAYKNGDRISVKEALKNL